MRRSTQIAILRGAGLGPVEKTITGNAPLMLRDAVNDSIKALTIYGNTSGGANVGDNGLNINVTNANIWDEDWEPGTYYSTGEHAGEKNDTDPNRLRSKNKIEVSMSDTHYVYTTRPDIYVNVGCYDKDNNFLGINYQTGEGYHNTSFLLYPNTRYIVFWTFSASAAQTPYNYGITFSCGSLPTEYIPYRGHTAAITTALPLRSNGNVKDELIYPANKVITRIDSNGDILDTPIETALSASEIAALESLNTYEGTTNIMISDDPSISVTYMTPRTTTRTAKKRTTRKKK